MASVGLLSAGALAQSQNAPSLDPARLTLRGVEASRVTYRGREATRLVERDGPDLEPGVWTRLRIVIKGTTARLFVHGADQPTLVVNDLKLGSREGGVALWIGPGTEGHFADLTLSR